MLSIAIQFVLVPLYLRHLGKEAFGILTMLLGAISYGSVGIGWMSGGMARILGERAAVADMEGFANASAFSRLVFVGYAILTISLFWIATPWLLAGAIKPAEISTVLVLASIYFVLMYDYNTDRLAFIALCRQSAGNLIDAGGQLVFVCCVVAGLHWGGGLRAVIVAHILGVLFTRGIAWIYWYRNGLSLRWKWPLNDLTEVWSRLGGKMGQHYLLYGALLLTLQADTLILGWLAGPEVAATFYLLWRIPEVCILLLARVPGVFSPHLIQMDARGEADRIQRGYLKGLRIMMALSAMAGLGYALVGNWFVHLWVGASAPADSIPYALAGMALFFVAASQWPAGVAYSLAKTDQLVKVTALQLTAKLAIFFLILGFAGYLTPVIATILTHVLGIFFLYLKIGKQACSYTEISPAQQQTKAMHS